MTRTAFETPSATSAFADAGTRTSPVAMALTREPVSGATAANSAADGREGGSPSRKELPPWPIRTPQRSAMAANGGVRAARTAGHNAASTPTTPEPTSISATCDHGTAI